jgi:hypothetical protein
VSSYYDAALTDSEAADKAIIAAADAKDFADRITITSYIVDAVVAALRAKYLKRMILMRTIVESPYATHEAGDAHKGIVGPSQSVVVRSPALHAETCIGLAVDQWQHSCWLAPSAGLSCD